MTERNLRGAPLPESETAEYLVARAVLGIISVTLMLYVGVDFTEIRAETSMLPPSFAAVAIMVGIVFPVLLWPLSRLMSFTMPDLRKAGSLVLVGALVSQATWPLARLAGEGFSGGWPHQFVPFYAMLAGVVVGWRWLPAYWCVQVALVWLIELTSQRSITLEVWVDVIGALGPPVLFSGLVWGVMRYAVRMDQALQDAKASATALAVERATADTVARINGKVHDEVLATLSAVQHRLSGLEPADLRAALAAVESIAEHDSAPRATTTAALASDLALTLRARSRDTVITVTGNDVMPIEADVADALRGAVLEAFANSLKHADPGSGQLVTRVVDVALTHDRIAITVMDDGVGFEEDDVAPDRFGIRSSIRGRVDAHANAAASIAAAPGGGTRVTIEWRAP